MSICRFDTIEEMAAAARLYSDLTDQGFSFGFSGGVVTCVGPRPLDAESLDAVENFLLTFELPSEVRS